MKSPLFLTVLFCTAISLITSAELVSQEEATTVLQGLTELPEPAKMMEQRLNALVKESLDLAAAKRAKLATAEEIAEYQQNMRSFFEGAIGGFPERTRLNPRVVGQGTSDGFRYEKIIFESRPKFFVTAVIFLPTGPGPYPGVLVPCGHSDTGKAYESYQRLCIGLARNGMAALIYDPIDQGERGQLLTPEGKTAFPGTTGHMLTSPGSILLGKSAAHYRIWDGIRALDYLAGREDIDPARLGCCGNSGGGTLTSYLMALDDRILCAAPSCYITSLERLFATIGPQDAEQNIHGQAAFGMDHADYLCMRAPRPTLVCCATRDFFDIQGTWASFRDAKRMYGNLGFPERMELVEANAEHGYTPLLRQATIRWMRRWLMGMDDAVVEGEFRVLTDEEMRCAPDGQVLNIPGARSVYDINREELASAKEQGGLWALMPRVHAGEFVRAAIALRPVEQIEPVVIKEGEPVTHDGFTVRSVVLQPEAGVFLPALHCIPDSPSGGVCLYAHGGGKAGGLKADGPVASLLKEGVEVFAVDLRGTGETAAPSDNKGWNGRFGGNWADYFRAYHLGRPWVGLWTEDLLACAKHLGAGKDLKRILLHTDGEPAVAAMHAAALAPEWFSGVRLENPPVSWAEMVQTPEKYATLSLAVHGALQQYDWPELERLIPVNIERMP